MQKTLVVDGIEYKEEDVILFSAGLPGFEQLKKFVISSRAEHAPFHWLHSVSEEKIRFILINPLHFRPDYAPNIRKEDLDSLGVERKEDLLLYVMVTLSSDIRNSTANMSGPILINIRRHVGMQVILDDQRFPVKEPILRD